MGATKITSECLWHDGWPVWGYVGVESAQSSSFGPGPPQPKVASYTLLHKIENHRHYVLAIHYLNYIY